MFDNLAKEHWPRYDTATRMFYDRSFNADVSFYEIVKQYVLTKFLLSGTLAYDY